MKEAEMFHLKNNRLKVKIFAVMILAFPPMGYTDDVTDSINEGLQQYKEKKYSEAVQSLNYASQLIQQKKGASLETLLPEPLSGWTAKKASSQAAGAAMFGGGLTAERKYKKGSSSVEIQIIADSPMLQSVMMMFTNPMFATSDGGKLEKVGDQKAIVKYDADSKRGDIKIVVANRFLITIEGKGATKEDLEAYAKAIDYKKLESIP
jgi:hypothetical protein